MINESLLKNEERAVFALRDLYSGFGYTQFKMSKFEEYDLYVKNKDFLISDRIITFTDTNGKLLALKPDVTLSIINNYQGSKSRVQKMYYSENVYRVSGKNGRFKEIMQTGLEALGRIGLYEIAEVVYLASKSLALIDGDFRLELAHASLLQSLLSDAGVKESVLNQILDAICIKSRALCQELKGRELITDNQLSLIGKLIENYTGAKPFYEALSPFALSGNSRRRLDEFISILDSACCEENADRITVNFSLAANSGYYSGIVFKGFINGIPVSVLSGGQYDKLMKKFGEDAGAVGFAVYLDSFEGFKAELPEYDVDTVILISENVSPKEIIKKTEELKSGGEKVLVLSELPDGLRYRRLIKTEG